MSEEPTERGIEQRVREFIAASRAGAAGRARGRVDRERRRPRTLIARALAIVARAIGKLRVPHGSHGSPR